MFCPLLGDQFKKSNYLEGIEHSASGFYAFNCVYVQHYILITQKELYQKCYHSWKFLLLSEKKKKEKMIIWEGYPACEDTNNFLG